MNSNLRIPPHSEEAERGVLGSVLLSPSDALAKCIDVGLTGDCFYDRRNQTLFQNMLDMRASGRVMDALTIAEWLKDRNALEKSGGYDHLAQLQSDTLVPAHVTHYANIVKEKRRYRKIIEQSSFAIDEAYKQDQTPTEILNTERASLFEIDRHDSQIITNEQAADRAIEHWDRVRQGIRCGLPWHISSIGDVFGNLQPNGNPYFIAAEPGGGKSVMLQNLLERWAMEEGLPVAFASLEMTKEKMMRRMLARAAEVNMWGMENGRYGQGTTEQRQERAIEWINDVRSVKQCVVNAPYDINDRLMNTDEMLSYFLRQYEYNGIVAAICDYFQLMNPPDSKKLEGLDVVKYNCDKSLAFSKSTGVLTMFASQITKIPRDRQGNIRTPEQDDLFGGRIIDAHSEGTVILFRRDGQDYANIAKNRNGNTGIVEVFFNRPLLRFQNPIDVVAQVDDDEDDSPF